MSETKKCSKCPFECPLEKVAEFFYRRSDGHGDGFHSVCKQCRNKITKAWAVAHPERTASFVANWAAAHPSYRADWAAAHPERQKAAIAAWKAANPEKVREYKATWNAANPEKVKMYQAEYYTAHAEQRKADSLAWRKPHPLYAIWIGFLQRCENPNQRGYQYYGALGIRACEGWHSFATFEVDNSPRPEGTTLGRSMDMGNYSCGHCDECLRNGWKRNVSWQTDAEQREEQKKKRLYLKLQAA